MPTIAPTYRGANYAPRRAPGPRRDGWVRILDYDHDKQAWENADVNDYAAHRRREEGPPLGGGLEHAQATTAPTAQAVYYLTYSANNWETPQYGVGYATADSPLGPFRSRRPTRS